MSFEKDNLNRLNFDTSKFKHTFFVNTANIFQPPTEILPGVYTLENLAQVDAKSINQAMDVWKTTPPNADFKLILDATNGS